MTHIRPLEQRNQDCIRRLLEIWESAVRNTHTFLNEADICAIKPEAEAAFAQVEHLYCFVDENGIIQGFIGAEGQKIELLFVDADARGNGIGKRLLEFSVTNLHTCYVDVNEQNEQGVGFYEHMGFATMSRSGCDEQGRPFPILHLKLRHARED